MYASYDEVDLLYVMMRGPIVASYDERTYCMPVMMRWTYCMPVMMRGHCRVMMEDLLYASYDEGTYCTPVMMRGPIVC